MTIDARRGPRRLVLEAGALADPPERLQLPSAAMAHVKVLRLGAGAELELMDGSGGVARGVLEEVGRVATVRILSAETRPWPSGPRIVLLQGVGKADKLDHVVRQVGELGAERLVPVLSERAVARREGKADRLRSIADDALRVSGRAHRLTVERPQPFAQALGVAADVRLAFAPGGEHALSDALASVSRDARLALLVGPEGGFSEPELAIADAAGFTRVHLGRYVLRTETAGPAAVAMVGYALGLY